MKVNNDLTRSAVLRPLLERARAAGYTPDGLRERLGVTVADDIGLLNRAPALERLYAARDAAACAMRLLYLESDEPATGLRTLLPTALQAQALAAGMLVRRGATLRARVRVDLFGSLALLADRRFNRLDRHAVGLPAGDMVYPPGSDSAMLANLVVTRDGERVLDLCTGSGIQALHVAARAASVVAVDIGPRAAALARLNAAVNGVSNLDVRVGDLYRPVRGERFDLIIANPPFVPAPERGPAYHSGGPRGDRVLRRVMSGLEAHLRPGGRAFAISHLALRDGESVADAVGPWVRCFGGRVLALVLEAGTPIDLAAAQGLFALDDGFAAYGREVRRWVAYLTRHRINQIVLLVLCAERGGRRDLEVVEAFQRTLPIPLSQPPAALIAKWLG